MKHVPGQAPAAQVGYAGGKAFDELLTIVPSSVQPSIAPELPVSAHPHPSAVTIPVTWNFCLLRQTPGLPASSASIIVFDVPSLISLSFVSFVECIAHGQRFSFWLIGPGLADTLTTDKARMGGMGRPVAR